MVSETSLAAQQCRLMEWAEQIRDCQNRAEGMSIIEWCSRNGITKANYYYRLRRVREACWCFIQSEIRLVGCMVCASARQNFDSDVVAS